MDPVCELLPWDSELFGFRVARTALARPAADDVAAMIGWCGEQGVRCLYHQADPDFTAGLAAVSAEGFQLIDIRHELEAADIARCREPAGSSRVREASAEDRDDLVRLVRASFVQSRFSKDAGFPPERVADLYEAWLVRALDAGWVLVAFGDTGVSGVVTLEPDGETGRIGLLAVDEGSRGESLGAALVRGAVSLASDNGFRSVGVVTQGSNIAALRTYEGEGFETSRVSLWYHRWF